MRKHFATPLNSPYVHRDRKREIDAIADFGEFYKRLKKIKEVHKYGESAVTKAVASTSTERDEQGMLNYLQLSN